MGVVSPPLLPFFWLSWATHFVGGTKVFVIFDPACSYLFVVITNNDNLGKQFCFILHCGNIHLCKFPFLFNIILFIQYVD